MWLKKEGIFSHNKIIPEPLEEKSFCPENWRPYSKVELMQLAFN